MILPWNRYEVYLGTSKKRFNEILDILSAHKIKYHYRFEGGGIIGGTGENFNQLQYIFIHKKDVDKLPREVMR